MLFKSIDVVRSRGGMCAKTVHRPQWCTVCPDAVVHIRNQAETIDARVDSQENLNCCDTTWYDHEMVVEHRICGFSSYE